MTGTFFFFFVGFSLLSCPSVTLRDDAVADEGEEDEDEEEADEAAFESEEAHTSKLVHS